MLEERRIHEYNRESRFHPTPVSPSSSLFSFSRLSVVCEVDEETKLHVFYDEKIETEHHRGKERLDPLLFLSCVNILCLSLPKGFRPFDSADNETNASRSYIFSYERNSIVYLFLPSKQGWRIILPLFVQCIKTAEKKITFNFIIIIVCLSFTGSLGFSVIPSFSLLNFLFEVTLLWSVPKVPFIQVSVFYSLFNWLPLEIMTVWLPYSFNTREETRKKKTVTLSDESSWIEGQHISQDVVLISFIERRRRKKKRSRWQDFLSPIHREKIRVSLNTCLGCGSFFDFPSFSLPQLLRIDEKNKK